MKLASFLPVTLAASAIALGQTPTPPAPVSPPVDEPGTRWLFSESTQLDCTFMRVSTDGEAREYRPFNASVEQSARRSWVDARPTAGHSLPFVRTYEDVGHDLTTWNRQSRQPDEGHAVSTSEVIGTPIRFVRPQPGDPDAGAPFRAELVPRQPAPSIRADGAAAKGPAVPGWLAALDPATGGVGLEAESELGVR